MTKLKAYEKSLAHVSALTCICACTYLERVFSLLERRLALCIGSSSSLWREFAKEAPVSHGYALLSQIAMEYAGLNEPAG